MFKKIEIAVKENIPLKYSEMLIQLVEYVEDLFPEELTFEDTLKIGIEAWNLANNKNSFDDRSYRKELKAYEYSTIIDKMVHYKLEKFAEYTNIIIDFSLENDMLQVKSQTPEEHFNSILKRILKIKPKKK